MKLKVEVEVDQEAYDAKYGPGTEWWQKYRTNTDWNTEIPTVTVKDASEYEFANAQPVLAEILVDILAEGLSDWSGLGTGISITVDGKRACKACGKLEGHKDWCPSVAGPEASEVSKGGLGFAHDRPVED